MSNPVGFRRGTGALSVELQEEARALYESDELSCAEIGAVMGVSKNIIVGLAHRHAWNQRRPAGPEPTTLFERMNALETMFLDVLRLYPPGTGRVPVPPPEKKSTRAGARR